MHTSTTRAFLLPLLLALAAASADAQEWPRFRGPNGSGTSPITGLPTSFGPKENLRWRAEICAGFSSPVLGPGVVFVTGADEKGLAVLCIARDTGAVRWEKRLERARTQEIYHLNGSATPSPVTDGANVFAFFPELGLVSFDPQGKERWRLALGPFDNFYGMSSSPILAGDALVLLCDQEGGSFLLAVDTATGKERWRTARTGMVESWTTPVLFPSADAPESVLVLGTWFVAAYSLETGAELWRQGGLGYAPVCSPVLWERAVPEPPLLFAGVHEQAEHPFPGFETLLADLDADEDGKLTRPELNGSGFEEHFGWLDIDDDGFVVAEEWNTISAGMSSKSFGLVAFELGGEAGPAQELWRHKRGLPTIATPLLAGGILYLVKDGGLLTTLDPVSGKQLAFARLEDAEGGYYASPIAADGKLFLANTEGRVLVLSAGAEPAILARCDLGEPIQATPAIGADGLYVRTGAALYCFAADE